MPASVDLSQYLWPDLSAGRQPRAADVRPKYGDAIARTWQTSAAGLWIPGGYNSITGQPWTTGSTGAEPTIVQTKVGPAIYSNGKWIQTDLPSASFSTVSWIALIQPDSAPITSGIFATFFQTGQATFNFHHTSAAYAGAFTLFNSGGFPTAKFTSGFTAGKLEVVGGTYDGTTIRVYRAGVLENSTASANGLTGITLNSLQFMGGTGSTAAWGGACPFFLWDTGRAYSAAEMARIMGDVWQVFDTPALPLPVRIAGTTFTATLSAATGASSAIAKAAASAKAATTSATAIRVAKTSATKSAATTGTATLSTIKAKLLTLAAAVSTSAAMVRSTQAIRAASSATAGAVIKSARIVRTGSSAAAGLAVRTASLVRSASTATAASAATVKAKLLTLIATVGTSAALGKFTRRTLTVLSSILASLTTLGGSMPASVVPTARYTITARARQLLIIAARRKLEIKK